VTKSIQTSSKLPEVGTTIFTAMSALAKQYGAVNLSQGFPDFAPDERLVEFAKNSLLDGSHQYALMSGNIKLREKIAMKYAGIYHTEIHPENEITVTAGGTQAIFTAIQAMVKQGDEVLLFAPCYDSYAPAVQLAGGKCVYYNMLPPNFQINWSDVESLVTAKTKLIVLNSPHNPSGTRLTKNDLDKLAKIVENKNCFLLSDEVYEHIVFDGEKHHSFLENALLRSKSFVISSFGKTYHTTGWKVGYCIAPPTLTHEFRKVHQFNVFSVNNIAQEAFAAILDFPELYENLPSFYEEKRNYFQLLLANTAFELLPCSSTYFQLAAYSNISSKSDVDFCQWLVKEIGVAAIPVSVFYSHNHNKVNLVRFCFAKQKETLELAAMKLNQLL
jgi:methionine aminotransferase